MAEDTATADRLAELERRLAAEVAVRQRLVEVATSLASTLNLDELLDLVMRSAAELLDAETSSLLLLDEATGELTIEVATGGTAEDVVKQRVPRGEGVAGWALEHRAAGGHRRPRLRRPLLR